MLDVIIFRSHIGQLNVIRFLSVVLCLQVIMHNTSILYCCCGSGSRMFLDLLDPVPSLFVQLQILSSPSKNSQNYRDFYFFVTTL
jgi:hypothetical protein